MGTIATEPLVGRIQQALPAFLVNQRWYRAKARTIASVHVQDVVTANGFLILLVLVDYVDGKPDTYLLPVASSAHQGAFDNVIATLETEDGAVVTVYSALSERGFRDTLFQAMACGAGYPGLHGEIAAEPSPYFVEKCQRQFTPPDSFVSSAEQSNSSIIYGREYIIKLFRKLEFGINPDIEIGRFLTRQNFPNTPSVLGTLEYRNSNGVSVASGILQQFIPNQGDAWKYTLDSLSHFFARALAPANTLAPLLPSQNPLRLMAEPVPMDVAELIGPYLASATLLGRRTAEMHVALSSSDEPDFIPEHFGPEDADHLHSEMVQQAHATFALLRKKQASAELLWHEAAILGRFASLTHQPVTARRIRHHGDYHLGQVLYTGSDFMIIDFEGEPARPLSERRAKAIALKDVAGMVRSFQYAAYAALFGLVPGVPSDADSQPKVEAWANVWNGWISAAYLNSYFSHSSGRVFAPSSEPERLVLLNAFLLQKALYEVAYELNNRPGWVGIPIRGILGLLDSET